MRDFLGRPPCIEAVRTAFSQERIGKGGMQGRELILARLIIDYRRELHYPGMVEVGLRKTVAPSASIRAALGAEMEG